MEQSVLYKDIEINGRKFRLGKFDARTGSYMLFKLVGILTPIFKNIDTKKDVKDINIDDINLTEVLSSFTSLPEIDFKYIQDNCLRTVKELLPGNAPQVLDEFGNYGILDAEYDTMLILNLTVQALIFNVSGFFSENLLDSITERLKDISPQTSQT
jgi:hypothetical protein